MNKSDTIQLAHGGGGRLTRELIDKEIVSRFGDGPLKGLPDAASLSVSGNDIIFTTDSFVVQPLEFPGGNIGDLAIHGTVNDISVSGGMPKWLSMGMILEEGLSIELLGRVLDSVKAAADKCGVQIVTGDTKVVAKGECDGIYINTSGIGEKIEGFDLGTDKIHEGDVVISSGTIGDHGMAVLSARKGIGIENGPLSDTAAVNPLVAALNDLAGEVRFMRDPTRGGVATVLNEVVEDSSLGIVLGEGDIPLSKGTKAVSEMLGLDPLHSACEGRLLAVCSAEASEKIIDLWKAFPEGAGACVIGRVTPDSGRVILETFMGGRRLVDVPRGEVLPRIC
ncbi:hydrogenase expression/formation protein HypE [bacterium B17]|nr:hydrogenase expression/formation protein HypE [bacterium B17]